MVPVVLAMLAAAGCGGGSAGSSASTSASTGGSAYQAGTVLHPPLSKPTQTFTDTHHQRFNIAKQTAGHATLVDFGYTHCPDVCPTTMANLATTLKQLPAKQRHDFRVVFITTDPHRDTPKRMRTWLDKFDPHFIGLTASWPTIAAAAKHLNVAVSKSTPTKNGHYRVTHGAQVTAFSPRDDKARRMYSFSSTTVQNYEHDLPLLAKGVGS